MGRFWSVLLDCRRLMRGFAACVRDHTQAVLEDFDRHPRGAHFDALARQRIRNAVVVVVDLYVIIDVHSGRLPTAELETLDRQRAQTRPIHAFQQAATRAFPLTEGTVIQPFATLPSALISS